MVHNIATCEIIDLVKNNPKNTDFQRKKRVFVGILSRLQFFTCCYIMNRTGDGHYEEPDWSDYKGTDVVEEIISKFPHLKKLDIKFWIHT